MSALPVTSLGTISVKEFEVALNTVSGSISTGEIVSSQGLNVTAADDIVLKSNTGNVVFNSDVTFGGDFTVSGAIANSDSDTLKLGNKAITLNERDDATDVNASGSGLLVCGTDYASFVSSNGSSGSKDSISVLWSKTGSTNQWTLKGGDLAFSKVLPNGDTCVFTFLALDSGDLVLKRQIGTQSSQMLAYWETI